MSTRSNKRVKATVTVDPALLGKLIGSNGCNIRRITSQCRAGCYIRGNGDKFEISAWTEQAVRKAAKMIKMDEAHLKDPTLRPSKPFDTFTIDPEIVPHIVGRGGEGLRAIMTRVGDGCFIVHRDGNFHISANSKSDIAHAKRLIFNQKKLLNLPLKQDTQPLSSSHGRYDALAFSSDDEDDHDDVNGFSTGTHPPEFNKSTFPHLPGTQESGNVKLEITGKSWKPNLAHSDTPVTLSHSVAQSRKLRKTKELEDQYTKYMSLYEKTLSRDPSQAHSYKLEAQRIHKLLNPSWADMADSDSDYDSDLGEL